MKKVIIINGPNLNLLGEREPAIYGSFTLAEIEKVTNKLLQEVKIASQIVWYQSNSESEIIEKIQSLSNGNYELLIINPGAFSHSSIAILDALKSIKIKKLEVHLSHTLKREEFRHKKITALGCDGIIEGLGPIGYFTAICSQYYQDHF